MVGDVFSFQNHTLSVSSHIIDIVEPSVGQGGPLLQPQVPANKEFGSRDRRGELHECQTLHHDCGHSLKKKSTSLRCSLAGTFTNQYKLPKASQEHSCIYLGANVFL